MRGAQEVEKRDASPVVGRPCLRCGLHKVSKITCADWISSLSDGIDPIRVGSESIAESLQELRPGTFRVAVPAPSGQVQGRSRTYGDVRIGGTVSVGARPGPSGVAAQSRHSWPLDASNPARKQQGCAMSLHHAARCMAGVSPPCAPHVITQSDESEQHNNVAGLKPLARRACWLTSLWSCEGTEVK